MRTVESALREVLAGSISEITQRSIFRRLGDLARQPLHLLSAPQRSAVEAEIAGSVRLFAPARSGELIASCTHALGAAATAAVLPFAAAAGGRLGGPVLPGGAGAAADPAEPAGPRGVAKKLAISQEKDIAGARLEAWSEAVRLGLSKFASVKVATTVSELARNIVFYAGAGSIELRSRVAGTSTRLEIVAADQGPGIPPQVLAAISAGTYKSERGMGKGLIAVQKLVDEFHLDSQPGGGTRITCVFRGER
jgi:anti-sigma regulatory factor (Ser/Thr protein kinase)